jgi:hypothetical protein
MGEGDFHFNVNVRTGSGSRAKMANNEDSFLRAMEIQERKQEKKEREKPEEVIETPPTESPTVNEEEVVEVPPVVESEAPVAETPPAEPVKAAPAPKPAGGGVPGPTPRSDFSAEERAAMLKRAKAHAAEVRARNK